MDFYHLDVKIHGRQGGKRADKRAEKGFTRAGVSNAVGAAAYRSGEVLHDERSGTTYRYARADRVKHSEIITPDDAPDWARDRAALWNSVEQTERRKDSQLMREIEVSLPAVLSHDQQLELVRGFVQAELLPHGMVIDLAIHRPDKNNKRRKRSELNDHCHISTTLRGITAEGWTKQKLRHLEDRSTVAQWRAAWANHVNAALERAGRPERVDHRSYAEQDADLPAELQREPTRKIGPAGKGQRRDIENQQIRERNLEKVKKAAIYRAQRDTDKAEALAPTPEAVTIQADVDPSPVPVRERTLQHRLEPDPPAPAQEQAEPQLARIVSRVAEFISELRARAEDKRAAKERAAAATREEAEARRERQVQKRADDLNAWRELFEQPGRYPAVYHENITFGSVHAFNEHFEPKNIGMPPIKDEVMLEKLSAAYREISNNRQEAYRERMKEHYRRQSGVTEQRQVSQSPKPRTTEYDPVADWKSKGKGRD